jgi:hypothetical protein
MSGGASVPLAALAIYFHNAPLKILFGCLTAFGVVGACYKVWRDSEGALLAIIATRNAEAQRLHAVLGDLMTQGEAFASELRRGLPHHEGLPVFGPWLQRRQEWIQRTSESLSDIGLPDEAAAFRHAVEGDADINQLRGSRQSQSIYWHRFYGSQLDKCREKLADIVARRLDFHP